MFSASTGALSGQTRQVGSSRAMSRRSLTSVETNGTLHASASLTEFGQPSVSDVQRMTSHAAVNRGNASCGRLVAMRRRKLPHFAFASSNASFARENRLIGSLRLKALNKTQRSESEVGNPRIARASFLSRGTKRLRSIGDGIGMTRASRANSCTSAATLLETV